MLESIPLWAWIVWSTGFVICVVLWRVFLVKEKEMRVEDVLVLLATIAFWPLIIPVAIIIGVAMLLVYGALSTVGLILSKVLNLNLKV